MTDPSTKSERGKTAIQSFGTALHTLATLRGDCADAVPIRARLCRTVQLVWPVFAADLAWKCRGSSHLHCSGAAARSPIGVAPAWGARFADLSTKVKRLQPEQMMETTLSELFLAALLLAVVVVSGRV